ncbi:MAG: PAS domain-containing hybrid sensor histidine kinase/response regulator [Acidiferrobacteraceae bacterium]
METGLVTPDTGRGRETSNYFQDTFGALPAGLVLATLGESIAAANNAYCRIVGHSSSELSVMKLSDLVHPQDRSRHSTLAQKLIAGELAEFELDERYVTRHGETIPVHCRAAPVRDHRGSLSGIVALVQRTDSDWPMNTLRCIGDGVVAVDMHERVVFMNDAAVSLTGWRMDEALGSHLNDIFHIVDQATRELRHDPVREALSSRKIVELLQPTLLIAKNGAENLIADSVSPIYDRWQQIVGAVLVFRDVTKKYQHDQELIKVQKLESVGVLAGGIAHDFNNLLTAVMGNIALVKLTASGVERQTLLAEAEAACLRARDLTQQLLTFANGGAPIRRVCGIAPLLKAITTLGLSGSNISCQFKIAQNLWPVEIDTGQIGQVINNLLLNAKEAMTRGGTVTVGAENVTIDESSAAPDGLLDVPPGVYVRITISDTGSGIAPAILGKIFDPYFTTKDKGNGLGLAICHAIVHKHGGYIHGSSQPGEGSCFSMYLPAWHGKSLDLTLAGATTMVQGSGRILIMDDDEQIRLMAERLLTHLGYQVSVAREGSEALALYQEAAQSNAPFRAVILDITVPGGMGGTECIRGLLELDPKVRAIISSGYSTDPVMSNFAQYGFRGVIMKPYDVEELSMTIYRVVNEPPSPPQN